MAVDNAPLISVIIPTYNYGHFIREAVESLFSQRYPLHKIEILVIDDGSSDGTGEIIRSEYGGRLQYLYQDNRGIAAARNRGIAAATGDIVTFLDADDLWHKERLAKVAEAFLDDAAVGIVYHPLALVDSGGGTLHEDFYAAFGYRKGLRGWITNELIAGEIFCGGSAFSFRRTVLDSAYPIPEDIRRGVDYYIAVLASCHAQAAYIPDILGKYRTHRANLTMYAGLKDYNKLAVVNREFAYMRQRIIERLRGEGYCRSQVIDLERLKRIQAKEEIFSDILGGKRLNAVKGLPRLFRGHPSRQELLRGMAVGLMACFIPARLYPRLVKAYGTMKTWSARGGHG